MFFEELGQWTVRLTVCPGLIDSWIFRCLFPQHLMHVTLLEDHSLVVVERPLLDIMSQLPAPVRQKKFAT